MSSVLSSRIDRVKVYSQGARVYRTLTATAPKHESDATTFQIEIEELPLSLDDASVKLLLQTHRNEWTVSNIRIGLHVATKKEQPETPDEEKLRELQKQITLLSNRRQLLLGECGLLERMEPPYRPSPRQGTPPPASPLAARLALEHFVSIATEGRVKETREITAQMEKLEEELRELKDQLARASDARKVRGHEVSKVLIATLERRRGESREVALELSYMVPGARWVPQYTCRIERTGESAHIQMRALVIQASGEDWKNAQLELSTADPMSWTELPKLSSLRIGKAQAPPPGKPGYRPPPEGASLLFRDFDNGYARARSLAERGQKQATIAPPLPSTSTFPHALLEWPVEITPQQPMSSYGAAPEKYEDDESDEKELESMFSKGAPMPAEEMALGAAASSSVFATQSFGGAPSGPPPPAPMKAAKKKKPVAPSRSRAYSASAYDAPDRDEEVFEDMAEDPYMQATGSTRDAFQELILSKPLASEGAARGKLRHASAEERYMQIFERSGLEADFSLPTVLASARQRALGASQQSTPPRTQDVRTSAGYFDYVYTTENRVDIPSDLTFHSIPVHERVASCSLRYVAVPREQQHVFRQASVTNPGEAPMLSGPAEIYVGEEYVLTTRLPTVAPMETFELGLGVEQAIKCARNTSFREERSGSAVVATAELHHEIRIELVNNLERTITCDVRERIPHPAPDAEVVIEEVNVSPPWKRYDQLERLAHAHASILEGGKVWNLTLDPGEQVELLAHYVVKIYANNEVVGGNRRES